MQDRRYGRKQSVLWTLSKEKLNELVARSCSLSEILRIFNITNNGTCMKTLKRVFTFHSIDWSSLNDARKAQRKAKYDSEYRSYITRWLAGQEKGWTGKSYAIVKYIKRYLREKHEDRCEQCGWDIVHSITGQVPLQVDHVDGDASYCSEKNLRLLCPNCHSLTPTFGRLNKETCRKHR